MSEQTANRWIITSAVVTLGVYFYRRLTEGSAPPVTVARTIGAGKPPVPLGAFMTGWGFVYLSLAVVATGAPQLAGGFAILIGAADVLANTGTIVADLQSAGGAMYPAGTPTAQAILARGGNPNISQAGVTPGVFNTPTGPSTYRPPTNIPGLKVVG